MASFNNAIPLAPVVAISWIVLSKAKGLGDYEFIKQTYSPMTKMDGLELFKIVKFEVIEETDPKIWWKSFAAAKERREAQHRREQEQEDVQEQQEVQQEVPQEKVKGKSSKGKERGMSQYVSVIVHSQM